MESQYGVRVVPLSALPWPHHQSKCPMVGIAASYEGVHDEQTSHAAAFVSREGREAMITCPYHQPEWSRLAPIACDLVDAAQAIARGDDRQLLRHPGYASLPREEKRWLRALLFDPIDWGDRDDGLTNGQHRLCALRAANVRECPVRGEYLPDTDHGVAISSADHARATVCASWQTYSKTRRWPSWLGTVLAKLPPMLQKRMAAWERRRRQSISRRTSAELRQRLLGRE